MTTLMKRISPTAIFLIVLLVLMVIFFVTSMSYAEMKVKLMPSLVSGFTIVLALMALIQDLRTGSKKSMPTDEDGDVVEDEKIIGTPLRAYFQAFLWFAALIAMVYVIGFVVSIPIWLAVYLWRNGHALWKGAAHGVVLTVIVYIVFTMFLQIELYRGVFGEWLVGALGL